MTKIKICGLTRLEDINIVNVVLPDYIGFVFAKSRRQIDYNTAKMLKENLESNIKAVGVFVNEDMEYIIKLCQDKIIDVVQLHGDESTEYIIRLRQHISNPIIKAARVKEPSDINKVNQLPCDYILLDAYHEEQYGGSGTSFDWNMVTNTSKPFFLAGGIHMGNIRNAIELCNPYCIDVSSGVETDGYKDDIKIKELINRIREN